MTETVPTTSALGSLWLDAVPPQPDHPRLTGDLTCDVAVVGGGIVGITTALLLTRAGLRVVVLEAGRVGGGVTGTNTAKVTALQATVHSTLAKLHGLEARRAYAAASLAGVELVAELAAAEGVDCDLDRRPAFTYATNDAEVKAVEQEHDAAAEAGLPVTLTDTLDVPFEVRRAVRLDGQIEFHPVKYVRGLAAAAVAGGSQIYENTRVLGVDDNRVRTADGTVTADHVVVASHYPILDRGLFFARLEPMRSYCVAARVDGPLPQGLSINPGSGGAPTRSLRSYGDLLVIGGEGHAPGSGASRDVFTTLEGFAREHWTVQAVTHRWSAQDPIPYDHLPIIGPYTPKSDRLHVASGFMKWGLSGGTFAARILTDLITGHDNPWAEHFSPSRVTLRGAGKLAQINAKTGIDLVKDRLAPPTAASVAEVPRGEARVVRTGVHKTGVFRDAGGGLHGVSLKCTHLGCLVRFNDAERSWDCPCHGSRFDVDGSVLEGPAVTPLDRRDVSDTD